MWAWLLNPKNIIIIGLTITCLVVSGLWQWERIHVGNLQNQVVSLQGHVDSLMTQVATRDAIIEDMKKNLTSLTLQMEEMKQAEAKTVVIRKKVKELVYVPMGKACETSDQLGDNYAKVAADISQRIISSVRGKVSAPRDNSGGAPAKAMPPSVSTGDQPKPTNGAGVVK